MNIFFSSKLLKEHESKYEPLGHDETFKIMEEILAMQIGINTEQVSFIFFLTTHPSPPVPKFYDPIYQTL